MSQSQLHLFVKQYPKPFEVNRSVAESDRPRLCRQALVIYRRLQAGSITTDELSRLAAQYNARLKEIRNWLRPQGLTVDIAFHSDTGNNHYEIRPFHGSRYEAELMSRQRKMIKEGNRYAETN
jgi:hypothetical protein